MTYILTFYLLIAGQVIGYETTLPSDVNCWRLASSIERVAPETGTTLLAYRCTLEIEV